MPKIIAFANLKGGVGKTMNLFNIAGILGEESKVLLIDLDPQCNLSRNCGIDIADSSIPTICDVFNAYLAEMHIKAANVIFESPIEQLPNIDIIPGSIMMFKLWKDVFGRNKIIDSFIKLNKKALAKYDYIMMDTSPSLSSFNVNAFYAADAIILNSDHDPNSSLGIELFCGLWDAEREEINASSPKSSQKPDNIEAIILGRYQSNTTLSQDMHEYLKLEVYSKDLILNHVIPQTVQMPRTAMFHKPINILAPKEDVTKAYRNVVDELKERGVL